MGHAIALAIQFLFVLLFIILGIVFSRGKGAFLIAGYNTASHEEKAKYDEKALCRFVGKLMFFCAGCFSVLALGVLWEHTALTWVGIGLMLVGMIAGVIYANTGNRFKKRK